MIVEIVVAVLVALVIARVASVVLRRLWEPVFATYLMALPKDKRVPGWMFATHEMVTNERVDE